MKKILLVLVVAIILTGCGENESSEKKETKVESTTVIAKEEKTVDENEESTSISPEELQHIDAEWEMASVEPLKFEAPVSWLVSDDSAFYAPEGPHGEYLGYYISVGFNGYRTGIMENFINSYLEQYEEVVVEDLEICGYPAARVQYNKEDDDGELLKDITCFIQVYPEGGVGIITYEAPASNPDLYLEDFDRLLDSLMIEETEQAEDDEKMYILNVSTGTFHEQDCYKVKQIENAETIVGTVDDLIAQGYKGCEICNPN